jgi:hypothetical protein
MQGRREQGPLVQGFSPKLSAGSRPECQLARRLLPLLTQDVAQAQHQGTWGCCCQTPEIRLAEQLPDWWLSWPQTQGRWGAGLNLAACGVAQMLAAVASQLVAACQPGLRLQTLLQRTTLVTDRWFGRHVHTAARCSTHNNKHFCPRVCLDWQHNAKQ